MPNPLFESQNKSQGPAQGGGIFGLIYNKMYQSNPVFRDFANRAKGKSLEQVYAENGHDYNQYKNMTEQDVLNLFSKNGLV